MTGMAVIEQKVAVCIFGELRAVKKCVEGLYQNIIDPLNLSDVFDTIVHDDALYVMPESTDCHKHTIHYFQKLDDPYDCQTLDGFKKDHVYVFNAGQFGFMCSASMQKHFLAISQEIDSTYDPRFHFYEQCFMNNYFNRRRLCNYLLSRHCNLVNLGHHPKSQTSHTNIINHFCDDTQTPATKLREMKRCYYLYIITQMPLKQS
jgi:hypothetical protein